MKIKNGQRKAKLTQREAEYLEAAACEFYHKMKAAHEDTTYGSFITDQSVYDARDMWRKIEKVVGVNFDYE